MSKGWCHISKLGGGRRINHPREVVEEGQTVDVKIEEVDQENKRLSLALAAEMETDAPDDQENEEVKQYMQSQNKSEKSATLGTFGKILTAKLKEKEGK